MKITNGRIRRRVWSHDGKRRESWGWSVEVDGKQVRRQGWDSRAEAQDELDRFKEEQRNPKPATAAVEEARPEMTLAQAAERYLTTKSRKKTIEQDRRMLEHLKTEFGASTPLIDLSAARIAEYRDRRLNAVRIIGKDEKAVNRPLSAAAVNRPLALLRHLLRLAHEEWEVLPEPPRVKTVREPRGRLRWLTPEEAVRLLDACRASQNPDLLDYVELSLFTGMRQSEVLGLTWDRVDRARGVVLLVVTKSDRPREVPLNSRADAVLSRRQAGAGSEAGPVFKSTWAGLRTAWDYALRRAKVTGFRPHDLRHTFASWAIQHGATLPEVKDLLGHATLQMTMRYAHLSPGHLRKAAASLDEVIAPAPAPDAPASEPASQSTTGAQQPEATTTVS